MREEGAGVDALAFGAHPDDVELFCGGVLITLADQGHRTAVVDLSAGEKASNGTPEERAREAAAAARVMGLVHRENLGLPDTLIGEDAPGGLSRVEQLVKAVEVIRRLRPELVLLPWIEERHPDHVAAGKLLIKASYLAGVQNFETHPGQARWRVPQTLFYQQRHRFRPSFIVDTSAAAARKREAIACYSSQIQRQEGSAPTLINSSRAVDAIEARDRYLGSFIGTAHGEGLLSAAVPGLVDPVRFFRDNPFSEAHAFEPWP